MYENLFTASQSFMEIAILYVGKWNDIASLQEKMRQTLFHVGYSQQITLASKRAIVWQRQKRYVIQ